LYANHQEFIFSDASSPPLSKALANAVNATLGQQRRTGESGPIDWDFWIDAQDGEQSRNAKVTSVAVKGGTAHVALVYEFFGAPVEKPQKKRAVVSLSRTSQGCWLVEDVRRGKKSVMSYLTSKY
jgi:hypothetical protein